MKAKSLFYAAVVAAVALSCTREAEESGLLNSEKELEFTAEWEETKSASGGADSRTVLQDDGTSIWWTPNEEINVFFGTGSSGRFVSTNAEPKQVVSFHGTLDTIVGGMETEGDKPVYWAVYPYNASNTSDGQSVTLTVPYNQTGTTGTFADKFFPAVAMSDSYSLALYNVCGGARFSVTQEGVTKVIFKSNDGSPMAGKVKVGFGEDNRPQILEITNPVDSVVVDAPEGGIVPGTNYFAAMLPQVHTQGITIILRTQDKKAMRVLENAVTVNRSSFGVLDDVDSGLEYIDDEIQPGTNPDDFIQFEDPIAKYACVEKFDTNGDGEVSYAEAAAATLLKGLFNNWQAVTHFDEIKYFTGVRTTDGVFSGLANLESIIIPDFITTIGNFKNCISLQSVILPTQLKTLPKECFYGCSALREVTLPSTITTIPNYCFYDCSALESVDIPSSVSSLGTNSFSNCRSLIKIGLPSELSRIDDSAFAGCKSIVSISIPSSVTSMGTFVFSECSSLESVVLPSQITTLPNGTFSCCSNLSSIVWPVTLISIGSSAFSCGSDNISYQYSYDECNFRNHNYTLELPQSVTTIGKNAFNGIHHLIIPSTSFVSISDNSFGSTARYRTYLYVPSSLIEMYKSNSIWQNYKDRIFSLEDYPVAGIEARGKIGEPVDLGLSVKWASWNIGASTPEEYGNYFAWGATDTEWHNYYYWSSYELCLGKYSSLTKYNNYGNYGLVDGKTVLEPIDDAATSNWGANWRMPTIQEWNELMNSNNCIWEWTTLNGVYGRKVTSRKENHTGKWIFLPAAGLRATNNGSSIGTLGYYWSSSLYTAEGPPRNPLNAYNIRLYDCGLNSENQIRYSGLTIRPVCD